MSSILKNGLSNVRSFAGKCNPALVVGALALTGAVGAHAAMDTTAITTAITEALTAIAVVGAAVMGVHVAVKAYRWVRAAMA
jgi:hypothetical protein